MQKFFTKIKIDDALAELFLSFLMNGKYQVPALSAQQEDLISNISGRFLISGFLLKSCTFNSSHETLFAKLKEQRKNQFLRHMSMKDDCNKIAQNLNERAIEHVFMKGLALNSDGIYPSGIRASRDIDLLVRLDQLSDAYDALKMLGFKYLNRKTKDSVKYNQYGHHFPVMINGNNTKLELHWRVTRPRDFKSCPFTNDVLANRRISNTNHKIFCPPIEMTVAHIVHHSFETHRMNLGPIFLFDLAAIFVFFNKNWPIDNELHKRLGIERDFEHCKKIIERLGNESRLSLESMLKVQELFENSHWLRLSDGSSIPRLPLETTRVKVLEEPNLFSKILLKARSYRTIYQVPYHSAKFWLILVSDILRILRKAMRR